MVRVNPRVISEPGKDSFQLFLIKQPFDTFSLSLQAISHYSSQLSTSEIYRPFFQANFLRHPIQDRPKVKQTRAVSQKIDSLRMGHGIISRADTIYDG